MKTDKKTIEHDEMRPEYDFSKLILIGRGIYAEQFRRGTNLAQLIERDRQANEEKIVQDLRPERDSSETVIAERRSQRKER